MPRCATCRRPPAAHVASRRQDEVGGSANGNSAEVTPAANPDAHRRRLAERAAPAARRGSERRRGRVRSVRGRRGLRRGARRCSPPALHRLTGAPADPARGADRGRGRAPRRRPRPDARRRRGRALPGVGDAAVRAGVAGARDDGPPAPHHVAAARGRRRARRRSSSRRCARSCSGSARTSRTSSRSSLRKGDADRPRRAARAARRRGLPARVPGRGARRGRGARLDRRRVPVDRRPPGAHRPLGRRGRPALASSRSPTSASTRELDEVADLPVPRAARRPPRCASAPRELLADRAVGRGAVGAARRGPDLRRHGVVAAVAHRGRAPAARPAARRRARCCSSSPAGMRDRAQELLDEEASARRDARGHLGRRGRRRSRASRCRSTGCSRTPRPARRACSPSPGLARHAAARRGRVRPGRRRRRGARRPASGRCATTARASSSPPRARGSASACATCSPAKASRRRSPTTPSLEPGTLSVVVAPLERGVVVPGAELALVAEADLTGRRRVHRRPRERAQGRRLLRGPRSRATSSCTRCTASAATRAWSPARSAASSATTCCVEYHGGDKLYVPDGPGRHDPPLHRRRVAVALARWAAPTGRRRAARCAARCRRSRPSSSILYRRRLAAPGFAFSPDTPWQREIEDAFPYEETPDQLQAIAEVKADMERPVPMDRLDLRRRRLRQDRGRDAGHVQGGAGRQAGRDPRADDAAREPARPDVPRALRRLPGAGRGAVSGSSRQKEQNGGRRGRRRAARSTSSSARTACSPTTCSSRTSGLLVIDEEQRFGVQHKEQIKALRAERRRAHAHRDADPAHARDVAHRHPRPLAGEDAARGPPADPHLRRRVRRPRGRPRRSGASCCARARCFFVHNRVQDIEHVAAEVARARARARGSRSRTGRWTRAGSSASCSTSAEREYDVLVCTTIIESGLDMPTVNTIVVDRADLLGLAQLYQLRGRVGRRGQRAYAYLLHPRRPRAQRGGVRAAEDDRRVHRPRLRASRSRCATSRSAAPATCSAASRAGHIAAVGFDLYCELVTEAVGELKGEPRGRAGRGRRSTSPSTRTCRATTSSRDDVRMEAYRRLAAVTDPDRRRRRPRRVGRPLRPAPAAGRGAARRGAPAGRVRAGPGDERVGAEGRRRGSRASTLQESQKVRLRRLAPRATAKDDGEVAIPLAVAARRGRRAPGRAARGADSAGLRAGARARLSRAAAGRVPSPVKRPFVLLAVAVVAAAAAVRPAASPVTPTRPRSARPTITRSDARRRARDASPTTRRSAKALQASRASSSTPTDGGVNTAAHRPAGSTSLVEPGGRSTRSSSEREPHGHRGGQDRGEGRRPQAIFVEREGRSASSPKSFQDDGDRPAGADRSGRRRACPQPAPPTDAAARSSSSSSTKAQSARAATSSRTSWSTTQAEADAIEAQLARRRRLRDAGRGAVDRHRLGARSGGSLGCTDTQQFGQLDPTFQAAVADTPVGPISAPVQTEFGFHVIKVATVGLRDARPVIEQAYAQQQEPTTR